MRSMFLVFFSILWLSWACTQEDGDDGFPWCIPDRDPGCECIEGSTRLCGESQLGICRLGMQSCEDGVWGECLMEIGPQEETCDGLDNDCDGVVDNDLTAPPCENQVGVCAGSTATCLGVLGWGDCSGENFGLFYREDEDTLAEADLCDGLDNDCDGQVDEGCACDHLETRTCSSNTGTCVEGTQTCEHGEWGACVGGVLPQDELCDGLDNDCDGVVDNDLTAPPCPLFHGVCGGSVMTCGGAEGWLPCDASSYPPEYVPEELPTPGNWLCNAIDDDCDGEVDEGCECELELSRPCGSSEEGTCRLGTQFCENGFWGNCVGAQEPVEELCDGLDNDCDGESDELWPELGTACGVGLCEGGTLICPADGTDPVCSSDEWAQLEFCNGMDDDCDGLTDELPDMACYSGPPGTSGIGLCQEGLRHCTNGFWGPCLEEVLPSMELCDGLDNDCDGQIDEGC